MPSMQGQVGEQSNADGSAPIQGFRQGRQGEMLVSQLHGALMEQTLRERIFSGGMPTTAINAATNTTATLGATAVPIAGLWNPPTSEKNAFVLKAMLAVTLTALQSTGPGAFMWCFSPQNPAITTGAQPWNAKTMTQSGSVMRNMAGVALTGLTNNLGIVRASALGGGSVYNIANLATAAGFLPPLAAAVEDIDGGIMVPPGGVLALLATTTPVGHSAASGLVWEEVPL